jgi:hypothetical protein
MQISASKLRENIYRLLDQVVETGVPVAFSVSSPSGCPIDGLTFER